MSKPHRAIVPFIFCGAVGLAACQTTPAPDAQTPAPVPAPAPASVAPAADKDVVAITGIDYAFDAPDVIPSGRTTIRFINEGAEHHMVFMSRLPEGKTSADYQSELQPAFVAGWHAVRDRQATPEQALEIIFGAVPEWFSDVTFVGGPGLAAPGVSSEVTLDLEPGNYVLECYVKTAEGVVHYMEGMVRPLTVAGRASNAAVPDADIQVTVSNAAMAVEGSLTPGKHTVAVHVTENPEQGFGHSVHVARLEPAVSPQKVVDWMNWFSVDGLRSPAPVPFIGGMHPMPTGVTRYFTVDLEPGRYLWVSEETGAAGVRQVVTVR